MEAVVSALTQFIVGRIVRNVRRKAWPEIPNTTAFFQLLQTNADSSSSMLPYSHGGFSCPSACWVCVYYVCVLGGGCLESFHSWLPADPWGHGGHSLSSLCAVDPFCPLPLIHRCVRSVDDGERWYVAMCSSRTLFMPSADCCERIKRKKKQEVGVERRWHKGLLCKLAGAWNMSLERMSWMHNEGMISQDDGALKTMCERAI